MPRVGKASLVLVVVALICAGPLYAQTAGTQDIFHVGLGARALGMGNAYVAMPQDPTAIYWNPGALDLFERRTATFFYARLFAGDSYSFVGYVHPTLALGTFGVGWGHLGVGGLTARDEHNVSQGDFGFSHDEFYFSFSKQVPYGLTVGVTAKMVRQALWQFTDSGLGMDVGIVWQPSMPAGTLDGLQVGLAIQNALSPSTRLAQGSNYLPHDIRLGVAVPVGLDMLRGGMHVYADVEKGDRLDPQLHLGTEYWYQNRAALRVGFTGGELNFGAGYKQGDFILDYSYGRFASGEVSPSHRFSLTVEFGKTRAQIAKEIEEQRARELAEMARRQAEWERRETIDKSLRQGRKYLEEGDYYAAYREFARVLALDPENPEAKALARQADEKISEQLRKEAEEQVQKEKAKAERLRKERFAKEHMRKGMAFMETGEYLQALKEFQTILEQQPDNDVAKHWIEQVHKEINKQIETLVREAEQLLRQGRRREAVRKLRKAQELAADRPQVVKFLEGKINSIEQQFDFATSYQQGITYYSQKKYKAALQAFERALKLQPNNEEVKRWYMDAKSRAFAKDEPIDSRIKTKYLQGLDYFTSGEYEKALQLWEECLKFQPYNKKILDAIDQAREKLRKK